MIFVFSLNNVAPQNSEQAQIRECTRMASICWCINRHTLHKAIITDAPSVFRSHDRWKFFRHLYDPGAKRRAALKVVPAENARVSHRPGDIGFKCSVNTKHDRLYLQRFRLLVAHEYDEPLYGKKGLLPVPFFVHDRVIEAFIRYGLFEDYLDNNLRPIWRQFSRLNPDNDRRLLAWCGATCWEHRREFLESAPHWLANESYESTHAMHADDHIRWLRNFKGALVLPGDTPKVNLTPLLALFRIAIVYFPVRVFDTPPVSEKNAIMFSDWNQVRLALRDWPRLSRIVSQAFHDYRHYWSPEGQAKLIVERIRKL